MRVLLAGILGGLVFFFWGFLAHEVFGLGQVGLKDIPNEQVMLSTMRSSINEPGLYFFPGLGLGPNPTSDEKKAAMERFTQKATSGPMGLLAYRPVGSNVYSMRYLGTEFALDVVLALIGAILIAWAGLARFGSRVAFVTLAGVMAALLTNVQYCNWYAFPRDYTLAAIATQVIGFFLSAIVIAMIVRPSRA